MHREGIIPHQRGARYALGCINHVLHARQAREIRLARALRQKGKVGSSGLQAALGAMLSRDVCISLETILLITCPAASLDSRSGGIANASVVKYEDKRLDGKTHIKHTHTHTQHTHTSRQVRKTPTAYRVRCTGNPTPCPPRKHS